MDDFKVIETQEDFDKAIQKRLERKEKEVSENFKDYLSPEKVEALKAEYEKKLSEAKELAEKAAEKLKEHDKIVSDLTDRATKAESEMLKSRIAHENGVPFELANRLVGNNEEELRKDAETLAQFMQPSNLPPMRTSETPKGNDKTAALSQMLAQLNGGE